MQEPQRHPRESPEGTNTGTLFPQGLCTRNFPDSEIFRGSNSSYFCHKQTKKNTNYLLRLKVVLNRRSTVPYRPVLKITHKELHSRCLSVPWAKASFSFPVIDHLTFSFLGTLINRLLVDSTFLRRHSWCHKLSGRERLPSYIIHKLELSNSDLVSS